MQPLLDVIALQRFIERHPISVDSGVFPALTLSPEHQRVKKYKELLHFLSYTNYVQDALVELQQILTLNALLDQSPVESWILKHEELFKTQLFSFGLEYMDSGDNADGNLHLPAFNEYVDRVPFVSIIQFWECMWLLYFGQYHLPVTERVSEDKLDYYAVSNDEELGDLEKVFIILNSK